MAEVRRTETFKTPKTSLFNDRLALGKRSFGSIGPGRLKGDPPPESPANASNFNLLSQLKRVIFVDP